MDRMEWRLWEGRREFLHATFLISPRFTCLHMLHVYPSTIQRCTSILLCALFLAREQCDLGCANKGYTHIAPIKFSVLGPVNAIRVSTRDDAVVWVTISRNAHAYDWIASW